MKGTHPMPTKSQKQTTNVTDLIKSRNGVLWINSKEEQRIEWWLIEAAKGAKSMPFFWDCAAGATDVGGRTVPGTSQSNLLTGEQGPIDAAGILKLIGERAARGERELWIL